MVRRVLCFATRDPKIKRCQTGEVRGYGAVPLGSCPPSSSCVFVAPFLIRCSFLTISHRTLPPLARYFAEAMDLTSPPSARVRAWQLLGEHLGMFAPKVHVTAWIREMAIKEGMDPDEAVREAQAILDSQK